MGVRWSVSTWHALSNFNAEERGFLLGLWNEVIQPSADRDFKEREALREEFHRSRRLPDSTDGWSSVGAIQRGDEIFFETGNPVSPGLIPPFPATLNSTCSFIQSVPLTNCWHVLFGEKRRELGAHSIVVRLDAARRHYAAAFLGLLGLLWEPSGGLVPRGPALPPQGSEHWATIRRLFSLFEPDEYIWVIRHLAKDHGPVAILELDYAEEIGIGYDAPDVEQRRERFLAKNESLGRVLRLVESRDYDTLAREEIVQKTYEEAGMILGWMNFVPHHRVASEFARYALTEEELEKGIEFHFY